MAGGMTPAQAVENLLAWITSIGMEPVLVLPSMARRPQSGTHPRVIVALLDRIQPRATLGIPGGTAMSIKRRWEHLARRQSVATMTLGRSGWDRVEFQGDVYRLDAAYMPAEVTDAASRLVVPALGDDALALGFWREIAHPHTRLRTHNSERQRMLAELSTVVRAHYLLDATRLPAGLSTNLVAWTDNPVVAELVALGIRRYADDARGSESVGPWENERVQAAAEIGHGPLSGSSILLRADPSLDAVRLISVYLADQLGCGIEWLTGGKAGD